MQAPRSTRAFRMPPWQLPHALGGGWFIAIGFRKIPIALSLLGSSPCNQQGQDLQASLGAFFRAQFLDICPAKGAESAEALLRKLTLAGKTRVVENCAQIAI